MNLRRWLHRHVRPYVDYHQHRYARTIDSLLHAESRWLDLGAGSRIHGWWESPTPRELFRKAAWLVGSDVQAKHLREHPTLHAAVVSLGEALPFESNSFDLVSANMVLEHLADPLSVFAEIERVLKPGGALVFVTPNRSHPLIWLLAILLRPGMRRLLALLVERHRAADRVFLTHYLANTTRDVRGLGASVGLEIQTLEAFASYPMFDRFLPLLVMEIAWIRLASARVGPLQKSGSNLLGVLRKPG